MIRLADALDIVNGKVVCIVNGERNVFTSDDDLINSSFGNHIVTSISSEDDLIVFELQPCQPPITDMDDDWIREYKEENGSEPSFF